MSFPLDFLLSIIKIKKNTKIFQSVIFGYMGNILFHYSIPLMDMFNILPMGLEVLEKNGIIQQDSVKKIEVFSYYLL